jgi:hypothetical protein
MLSLKLPQNLIAGTFLLLGLIANQTVVQAQTFVLQGEKGDSRFSEQDANLLQALLTKLKANGNSLEITADIVSLKPATANTKVTLDLSSSATLRAGNNTIDFSEDVLTVTAKTFSITAETKTEIITPSFLAKSANNNVALELDAINRDIRLQAANAGDIALFRLKHEFVPESTAPPTPAIHPSATFRNLNVHVQSGAGTTNAPINGRGNLIVGYNRRTGSPTALRQGSHNLIVGDDHDYQNFAGLVSGSGNTLIGGYATVAGGSGNSAGGTNATVAGGSGNSADKNGSSVCSSLNVKILQPSSTPLYYCCGQTF